MGNFNPPNLPKIPYIFSALTKPNLNQSTSGPPHPCIVVRSWVRSTSGRSTQRSTVHQQSTSGRWTALFKLQPLTQQCSSSARGGAGGEQRGGLGLNYWAVRSERQVGTRDCSATEGLARAVRLREGGRDVDEPVRPACVREVGV